MGRNVIVVDEQDNKLRLEDIWLAHKNPGILHRAISVVLWRNNKSEVEILLQRRAATKPLWPMYWSNTVCTHPLDGEGYLECGKRRLKEELGIDVELTNLQKIFKLQYQADYSSDLSECEMDMVIVGKYDGWWQCNPEEVAEAGWVTIEKLEADLKIDPEKYTPWFGLLMQDKRLISAINNNA